MRLRPRKDRNHAEIVAEFERLGAVVVDLSALGNGVPDLMACLSNVCIPVECKDGDKSPSKRQLTADQIAWWMKARMNPRVVTNPQQVQETVEVLQQWVNAIQRGNNGTV
jgi:Holliday junction resolvase